MPACIRPNASFVHSYGPPSCVNAEPISDITSMYGATKTIASTTSQRNPSGPLEATVPSVSSPTNAQMVKNTMSNRRSDLMSLPFSARAKAVVCSTSYGVLATVNAPLSGTRESSQIDRRMNMERSTCAELHADDSRQRGTGASGERRAPPLLLGRLARHDRRADEPTAD